VLGGLVAGALMVAPVTLLTASPAEAAGMTHPLFDHPLDIHVNIGPSAAPQQPADLGGVFGEITKGIGGLLASGGVPTPAPNHPAGRTGSGSGSRGGSGSGRGGTTATQPADPAAPGPTTDPGLADPTATPPTAEPTESPGPSSEMTRPTPAPTPAPAGPAGAVVHSQLISSSDGASIAALDTLAIVLAGVGLVGPPAAAVFRGRRAAR
jgi:hypothetical protein